MAHASTSTAKGRRQHHGGMAVWLKPAVCVAAGLAAIGALALGIQYAVSTYLDHIALGGRSDDRSPIAFTIAGETLMIPANVVRFPAARSGGTVESVDLLLQWPSLEGYSEGRAAAFRDSSALAPLIHVTIGPRDNPLDSDARLTTVYARFVSGDPIEGPSGLTGRRMSWDSAYRGEELYYAHGVKFAVRCFAEATAEIPATCIRDVNIGVGLSMRYRFNRLYLGDWRAMDRGLKTLAAVFLGRS